MSQVGHLISKAGSSVEVEVPPIARIAPVADVSDLPARRRSFDFNDEIHATAIWAADLAAAEDHLTALRISTDLPGRKPKRDQDWIKRLCNQVKTTNS